jgi:endonuclease YncB( thermonuclease family)
MAGQTVIDGDSLRIGAKRYRLNGIDAPEADQVCPDGWSAGVEARYLEQLVEGKQIRCIRLTASATANPSPSAGRTVSTSAAPWSSQDK